MSELLTAAGLTSIWASGTGWGTFTYGTAANRLTIAVLHGTLPCRSIVAVGTLAAGRVIRDAQPLVHHPYDGLPRVENGRSHDCQTTRHGDGTRPEKVHDASR